MTPSRHLIQRPIPQAQPVTVTAADLPMIPPSISQSHQAKATATIAMPSIFQ
jgi:hypothetical protein